MILDKILQATKLRVDAEKLKTPESTVRELAAAAPAKPSFKAAISNMDAINFICEVKKASPSKGIMVADFDYKQIAIDYEIAGAAAISVLTEPEFFLGSSQYLAQISRIVKIPLLKKDFIIDPYQIYQAKVDGASAVLLICSALDDAALAEYLAIAKSLQLDALVETHDATEVSRALAAGTEIIGVNNRDLKTFNVDINTSVALRALVPADIVFVAESGIRTRTDVEILEAAHVNAVLIGETLVKQTDKTRILNELKGCHEN